MCGMNMLHSYYLIKSIIGLANLTNFDLLSVKQEGLLCGDDEYFIYTAA